MSVSCRALLALVTVVVTGGCGRIGFDWLPGAEADASFAQQDATFAQQDATFAQQDAGLSLMDPPSLAGIWSIQSLTVDSGGPTEVPRATGGDGVLGEFEMTSTGPMIFDYSSSTLVINNNLLVDYSVTDGTIAIQPDGRWLIVTQDSDIIVVSASLDADSLSLTWEQSDPRNNTAFTPPLATVMKRNYNFANTSTGDWNSLSIKYRGGNTYTPGGCVPQGGGEYQTIDMDWHFDGLLRSVINVDSALYSDPSCQNQISQDFEQFKGLCQEEAGRLLFWGEDASFGPLYADSQLTFPNGNMRVVVTNCLPSPSCLNLSEDHLFAPAP